MIEKTEAQFAQELRDIVAGEVGQLFLAVADPDEMAMACDHHPDLVHIMARLAKKHQHTASAVDSMMARVAARAASKAIDDLLAG